MSSGSCGERVFVDGAAEPVVAADPKVVEVGDEWGERCERRGLVKGAVRPDLVVVSMRRRAWTSPAGCGGGRASPSDIAARAAPT
jgi:hypothetical protein